MPLQIIRADVSNAAVIASIGKKAFRAAFEHLFNNKEELFEYLEHTYDPIKLATSIRKGSNYYFLAYLNGEAVGFVKAKKDSLNDQIDSISQIELQKIYVTPQFHGRGVGTALLNEVKNLAREVYPDYIWLDTHISNEKAIRLYERNGFKKMGEFYFTIGTQIFEYHLMGLAVAFPVKTAC